MKNKNMILAVALSVCLMWGYSALMNHYYPPKTQTAAQETATQVAAAAPASQAQQAPQQAQPTPTTPAAATSSTPEVDRKAVIKVENETLALTFRKFDGALLQAIWKKDGTRFFPEEKRDAKGTYLFKDFQGLGGAVDTVFEGEPQINASNGAQDVVFQNAAGDRLTYRLPQKGEVLDIHWQSSKGMQLLRKPQDEIELHGMSRVFALDQGNVESYKWLDILKDPWFGSQKELPLTQRYIGIDAGQEKRPDLFYFAAIWETQSPAERLLDKAPGYQIKGQPAGVQARLYLGPKQAESLTAFAKPCVQVIDFGFFGLVAKFFFWLLRSLQGVIVNWGWTLIIFSVGLRLALWPLNTKTTVQALRMKELEPHQKALQAKYEKFGSDMQKKAEMQKELMAFYKKNGHNPMGGCLPMLLQMPVFMALWSMFGAVFELRQAPWMFWLTDLSSPDKFYILPILLGGSMVAQQAITPAMGDPAQRKMMMVVMPLVMVFMFSNLASGLNLYYLFFNLVGLGQAWWVTKNYKSQPVVV